MTEVLGENPAARARRIQGLTAPPDLTTPPTPELDTSAGGESPAARARRIGNRRQEDRSRLTTQELIQRYGFTGAMHGVATDMARGVPIAGNFVSPIPASTDFRRSFPATSAIARFGTGGAALSVPSRALTGIAARSFPGTSHGANTVMQTGLGAGVGVGDAITSSGIDANAPGAIMSGILGGAGGAFGALGARAPGPYGIARPLTVSPSPTIMDRLSAFIHDTPNPAVRPRTRLDDIAREAGIRRRLPEPEPPPRTTRNQINTALLAGALGHTLTGGSLPAAALSAVLSNTARDAATRALHRARNSMAGRRYRASEVSPATAAIISALGISGPTQLNNVPLAADEARNSSLTGR